MLRGSAARFIVRPLTCSSRFQSTSNSSTTQQPPKPDAKAAEAAKAAAAKAAAEDAKKAQEKKATEVAAAAKAAEEKAAAAAAAKAEAEKKAKAAEEARKAEAHKAAIHAKAEEARKVEEAKKAKAAAEAAEKKKAEDAAKAKVAAEAAEKKKAEEAKAQAEKPAAEAADAAPAPTTPSASSAVEADRLHKLLSKQYEMLKAMQEEIELAKGERALQKAINRDVALKDVPRIMQASAQSRVDKVKQSVADAQVRLKEGLVKQSQLAIEEADKQRKELSKKNAAKELPWQKDSAGAMYTKTGRWFLRQQQGPESALRMTALEVGVVLFVILFWMSQRRKQAKKQNRLDAAFNDVLDDAEATKGTISQAKEKYNETVVRKDDDVRELLSFTCEQSVTLDSLSRALNK